MACIGEQCSTKLNEVASVQPQPRHYKVFEIKISSLLKAVLTFYDSVIWIRFLPDFQVSPECGKSIVNYILRINNPNIFDLVTLLKEYFVD